VKLLCGKAAAAELGVSRWTIQCMKKAGAPFRGNLTTVEWLMHWLEDHPEFVASRVYPRHQVALRSPKFKRELPRTADP
jgi:hypothetical protein